MSSYSLKCLSNVLPVDPHDFSLLILVSHCLPIIISVDPDNDRDYFCFSLSSLFFPLSSLLILMMIEIIFVSHCPPHCSSCYPVFLSKISSLISYVDYVIPIVLPVFPIMILMMIVIKSI